MLNKKRYLIEFGSSMLMYSLMLFASIWFIESYPDSEHRVWVALLPVLPAILAVIAVIRGLKQLDELQIRVQLTSFAVSFALVGLSTFTYGFLQNIGFPPLSFILIFPYMIAVWGITTPIVMRLYR